MTDAITSSLTEDRKFPPPREFSDHAHLRDRAEVEHLRQAAAADPVAFWADVARRDLRWMRPFTQAFDASQAPHARWFADGTLNLTDNCLDRHCETWRRHKAAIVWEGEPIGDQGPEVRTLTYQQLRAEVMRFANVLKGLGVEAGDLVVLYMPMVPESAVAMLACARIGAVHSVVFGGFSAEALRDRCNDSGAKVIVTADGSFRRGNVLKLKDTVDLALDDGQGAATVQHVVVVRRTRPETCGGMSRWPRRRRIVPRWSWRRSTLCSSSTPAERQVNPREFCTRPAAT
jgi:acetyl-CoA synthetase